MSKVSAIDYIMDDPREAARLKDKVDPEAWVKKYMAGRITPGMEVLSVGCGPGVILFRTNTLFIRKGNLKLGNGVAISRAGKQTIQGAHTLGSGVLRT